MFGTSAEVVSLCAAWTPFGVVACAPLDCLVRRGKGKIVGVKRRKARTEVLASLKKDGLMSRGYIVPP